MNVIVFDSLNLSENGIQSVKEERIRFGIIRRRNKKGIRRILELQVSHKLLVYSKNLHKS